MKKILVFSIITALLLSGCSSKNTGEIGGADGPTGIIVSEQSEITPVRMINVGGELYFDSGLFSDMTPRCGTLDGLLTASVGAMEVPYGDKEANFSSEAQVGFGYQNATSITKELPLEGGWKIFKKVEEYDGDYKYAFKIKGRHPNAEAISEYLILSDTLDITFKDITKHLFSSNSKDFLDIKVVHTQNYDDWGILMYAEDVTPSGVKVVCKQFGGEYEGELQTGTPWTLEYESDGVWIDCDTKDGNPLFWTLIAQKINKNDTTEWYMDFSMHYDPLPPGRYRIGKVITDFVESGNHTDKTYYAEFTIEAE